MDERTSKVPDGAAPIGLGRIARIFLKLGTIGFGGPVAHIALMQEELVDRRRLIPRDRFLEALGVTNLIPGPNSSELAIHAGYLLGGQRGALVAGACFALPAVVLMTGLSALYFAAGGFSFRDDLFAGLQPVVIAVLAITLWRLRSAVTAILPAALAVAVAALTVVLPGWEPVWLLGAGAVTLVVWALSHGYVRRTDRGERGAVAIELAASLPVVAGVILGAAALPALAWVFLKTGALLFGGGYVLVPLLEPEVVARGWLSRPEFLDGIALGQATPGPIVTASAFVGYRVAGVAGAMVATVAIYAPAFLAVMAGTGPFLRRFREAPGVRAFISGVNAAALGAIAGVGIVLSRSALSSATRVVVGVGAAGALLLRVPIWLVLLAGAAIGLAAGGLGWV